MGAKDNPTVEVELEMTLQDQPLAMVGQDVLLPDIVEEQLVSPLGSISLQNCHDSSLDIVGVRSEVSSGKRKLAFSTLTLGQGSLKIELYVSSPVHLAPGQTRPVAFKLDSKDAGTTCAQLRVEYCLLERMEGPMVLQQHEQRRNYIKCSHIDVHQSIKHRRLHELHKVNFLHPAGVVSTALLRAPQKLALTRTKPEQDFLPVMVNLHGAGIDVASQPMRHSLDAVIDELPAWVLFPAGVTSWGADDWHNLGWSDAQASISAIRDWIENVNWTGPSFDNRRLLVAGHSNGGQGVWHVVSHRPSDIIAAAAVSGYNSIQAYVPFSFWHETEAVKTGILNAALDKYRHELLVPANAAEIPMMLQHGSADDNVPAFHSRRMRQLLGNSNSTTSFQELPGYGHWFEGVMTTKNLRQFFIEHFSHPVAKEIPEEFSLMVANPAEVGPKYGLHVQYLISTGIMGKVTVSLRGRFVHLQTVNIHTFELIDLTYIERLGRPSLVIKSSLRND
ncbi:MAG: hypothetical protein M1831_006154 [Alyxoria varia]|nr:MAG: hypothetical protein M1831_006154 [Alyxoria varia]